MRFVAMILAMTILLSGVLLLVTALAFMVGSLMGETWMGFSIVGGLAMACGGGVMTWAVHSLSTRSDLRFPATRDQIRRDREWLDRQLGDPEKQNSSD